MTIRPITLGIITAVVWLLAICPAAWAGAQITVIPGTFHWDVDCNCIKGGPTADFRLNHSSRDERHLVVVNKAAIGPVHGHPYETIDLAVAKVQALSQMRLSGSDDNDGHLQPGKVYVFRTTEGRYGKMEILGFHSSHDFSFSQAAAISDGLKALLLKRPVIENYHLEVRWELLEKD